MTPMNSNTKPAKEVTAVVEHSIQEEDLTHPALYRFKMNTAPVFHYSRSPTQLPINNATTNYNDWDLYPSLMRSAINEGYKHCP
ncbi:hypothetical protein BDB01DRAFT_776338 [Pilobolus umbonatus]|nr:hypothetical protein BDB01DRAFT_776338 [Pilobolus umbonatus]